MQELTGNRLSQAGTIFAAVVEFHHASHGFAAALRIKSRIRGFLTQCMDGTHDQFVNRMKMPPPDFFLHQAFGFGFKLNSNLAASGARCKLGLSPTERFCRFPGLWFCGSGMILSVFGTQLAASTQLAGSLPLPITLAGVSASGAAPGVFTDPNHAGALIPGSTGKPGDTLVAFITGEGSVSTALSLLPQPMPPVTMTVGGVSSPPASVTITP